MIRLFLVALLLAAPCVGHAESKFLKDMKAAVGAGLNPKVRGRAVLAGGKTLTCFVGVKVGYMGPPDLQSPAYNIRDPRTGRIVVVTAELPTIISLPPATYMSNNCDELERIGVLKPDGAPDDVNAKTADAPPAAAMPSGKVRDAVTLCKISPALAISLQEEAMQFVRIEGARILVSEKRLGKRSIVALDGEDFAQRATEAAAGIAARGPQCGKAFWDNEAIQSASLALQGR
jgi:hypothetical protein